MATAALAAQHLPAAPSFPLLDLGFWLCSAGLSTSLRMSVGSASPALHMWWVALGVPPAVPCGQLARPTLAGWHARHFALSSQVLAGKSHRTTTRVCSERAAVRGARRLCVGVAGVGGADAAAAHLHHAAARLPHPRRCVCVCVCGGGVTGHQARPSLLRAVPCRAVLLVRSGQHCWSGALAHKWSATPAPGSLTLQSHPQASPHCNPDATRPSPVSPGQHDHPVVDPRPLPLPLLPLPACPSQSVVSQSVSPPARLPACLPACRD